MVNDKELALVDDLKALADKALVMGCPTVTGILHVMIGAIYAGTTGVLGSVARLYADELLKVIDKVQKQKNLEDFSAN